MKISQTGINLIKKFEGCVLFSYKDPVGVWTIGYGHTVGVKSGQKITQAQAEKFLKDDLLIYEKGVTDSKIKVNQNQFDALVSFAYNCGVGSLKTLLSGRTLNQIGNALTLYNKADGRVLQGLINRRQAEKDLFNKAVPVSKQKVRNLKLEKVLMRGDDVTNVQNRLVALYFYPDINQAKNGVDVVWGKDTDNAYRRWQSVYTPKLVDGIHGTNGIKVLNSLTDKLI